MANMASPLVKWLIMDGGEAISFCINPTFPI